MTSILNYNSDIRPSSSNSRKSSNESIEYSIDSRSYSIDSRSYSVDSRSYSIDSINSSIAGSFEEKRYIEREKLNRSPFFEVILNNEQNKNHPKKRRQREIELKKNIIPEPKTAEEVKKHLAIFKKKK